MSPREVFIAGNGEPRRIGIVLIVLLIASAAFIESCAVLRGGALKPKGDAMKFNHGKHEVHVKDCAVCHLNEDDGSMHRPAHEACVTCHAAAKPLAELDGKPGDDSCLKCHHTTSPVAGPRPERPKYDTASFEHTSHTQTDCAVCHGNVLKMKSAGSITFPTMEDCVKCHFPNVSEPAQIDCDKCHVGHSVKTKPKSHDTPAWQQTHGREFQQNEDLCARCHVKEQDCQSCHSMMQPKSHTAAFRAKTHGFTAMNKPESCETCHTQDFCEACHSTTEPSSHTAAFKGRPHLHCATCHLPLEEGNRCSVCHHQADPHEGIDAPHPPAALIRRGQITLDKPCLTCHPVDIIPIPHPYNTVNDPEDCARCHWPR